jgi:tetratricopeptide (TPR) repeat protein
MSSAPLETLPLVAAARAYAASEQWDALRSLLATHEAALSGLPEVEMLRAEADLSLGQPQRSKGCLTSVVRSLERTRRTRLLRRALNLLGASHFALGELDEAEAAFERALALARAVGDDLLVARTMNNLGAIANIRGMREAALAMYQHCLVAYQRIGNPVGLAESFHNMAITYRDLTLLDRADECERRVLEFAREAGSARLMAMARTFRAELSLVRGDAPLAEAGAQIAAQEYAAISDHEGEADALRLIGAARAARGAIRDALEALDSAVAKAHACGSALIEAEALLARARVRVTLGHARKARDDARASLAIFTRLGAAEVAAVEHFLNSLQ